jgi:hypothetical protein
MRFRGLPIRSIRRVALLATALLALGWMIPGAIPSAFAAAPGWVVECGFVRHLPDDPIVYPKQPGASHLHAFFGNTSTNASSTYTSLRAAGTTCAIPEDTAAYWVPALYSKDRLLTPEPADFYYRNSISDRKSVRPFPAGLKIIAGDAKASGPQSLKIVYWDCDGGGDPTNRPNPVDCGAGQPQAHVIFPECWDGTRLDSPNHKSHMAYSVSIGGKRVCPSTHPVPVPGLTFVLEWPVHDGRTIRFSSGPYYTLHADFFNAWNQAELTELVDRCIRAGVDCGTFNT